MCAKHALHCEEGVLAYSTEEETEVPSGEAVLAPRVVIVAIGT